MADRHGPQRPQTSSNNDRTKRFKPHHGHHQQQHRGGGPLRASSDDFIPETYLTKVRSIGNTPEDIAQWREERRRRFPRSERTAMPEQPAAQVNALSAHFAAYASDDDEEEEERREADMQSEQQERTMGIQTEHTSILTSSISERAAEEKEPASSSSLDRKPCTHFARFGRCKFGARCRFAHEPSSAGMEDNREEENVGNAVTSTTATNAKLSKGVVSSEMLLRKLLQDVRENVPRA